MWVSLLALVILVVGTVTIRYQCRQLSKRIQQIRGWGQEDTRQDDVALCSKELKEVRDKIWKKQRESHQSLASELKGMREMQKEVKSNLAGLQVLMDQVSEKIRRETRSPSNTEVIGANNLARTGHDKNE